MLEHRFETMNVEQGRLSASYLSAVHTEAANTATVKDSLAKANQAIEALRSQYKSTLKKADPSIDTNDTNYIFLRFVVDNLPAGLVGLLIAVIFLASWGSIAAALNSLASCTIVDFYIRFRMHSVKIGAEALAEEKKYKLSKWFTFGWGVFCIVVAEFSTNMGSLIQAVNEYGSLFYGVILGIFLVAFYLKK